MPLDFVINLKANGADEFAGDAKKVAGDLDKAEAAARRISPAMERWRSRLAALANQERKASFDKLSIDEKLLKVTEHRARVEQMLARADTHSNERRHTALRLRLAELKAQQSQLAGSKASSGGGFFGSLQGRLGTFGSAGLGGAIGGAIGNMIMGIPSAIGAAFRGVMVKLKIGDQMSDEAEMYGITTLERLKVRRAAPLAGLSEQAGLRSLAALRSSRATALTDPDMGKVFANYGVDAKMLADEDNYSSVGIGLKIFQSMGSEGSKLSDRPNLRKLFGGMGNRAAQAEAMFKELAQMSDALFEGLDADIKTIAEVQREKELFDAKVEDKTTRITATALKNRKGFWGRIAGIMNTASGGIAIPQPPPPAAEVPTSPSALVTPRTAGSYVAGIKKEKGEPTIQAPRALPTADALQRIGLFRGSGEKEISRRLDTHTRQFQNVISELQRMNHGLRMEE